MRRLVPTLLFVLISGSLTIAQVTGVSSTVQNKVAILEEFTGVRCSACPNGHLVLEDLLANLPGQAYAVAYHPSNSGFTLPYTGDEDFRRSFPNVLYSVPFAGPTLGMPRAAINRRQWSVDERLMGRPWWVTAADSIITEISPMNVGVIANYDESTMIMTLTAEVYYTGVVNDPNTIYVTLTENNLVSQQAGASGLYTQKHTFRESLTAQWGDNIASTAPGLRTFTYTYDNSVSQYDMSHCEVMAFVENKTNYEIYTGAGADVTMGTVAIENPSTIGMEIYPNPFDQETAIVFQTTEVSEISYDIISLQGSKIASRDLGIQNAGSHRLDLNINDLGLASGLYFLQLSVGEISIIQRIVVQ